MSIRMALKTIKNKNMGRSYNLKKSPINKGTAAKPSPMKEPISLLIGLGGAAITAGANAIGGAKNRKAQEIAQYQQQSRDASQNALANMGTKIGSNTKLVD